jgi:hypothetical protein
MLNITLIIFLCVIAGLITLIAILFLKGKRKDLASEKSSDFDDLLCKFVKNGKGKRIGESIAIDNDLLIIKSGVKYIGIPLTHVKKNGKYLKIKGLINLDKAEELGKKWLKEYSKKRKAG